MVRQRCGHGCVVCGNPLITYEHVKGWANTKTHDVEDITLLCSNHQRESTNDLLTEAQVRAFNLDPINLRSGHTAPFQFHFQPGEQAEIRLGGETFTSEGSMAPLVIDNQPVIWFERTGDELLFSMTMLDEFNRLLLLVRQNELVVNSGAFDVEFIGRTLTIRQGMRKLFARIRFEPPHRVVIERARWLWNGVDIEVTPDSFIISDEHIKFSKNWWHCDVGFVIGYSPAFPSPFRFARFDVNRYARPKKRKQAAISAEPKVEDLMVDQPTGIPSEVAQTTADDPNGV